MLKHKPVKENYAGAILIAYKLYEMFIKKTSFIDFENRINENYQELRWELENYHPNKEVKNE
jgi:hypothetical protein